MKPFLNLLLFLLIVSQLMAQSSRDTLSLEDCYEILYTENPVTDKIRTNRQIVDLNEKIAQSGWYPDAELNATASYQSDVVELPFEAPGLDIPAFSKDHYNLSLNITQPIFDGGRTNASKQLEIVSGELTEASLQSDLLNLKEQVDRIYFGILILEKQREIMRLAIADMNEQLEMVQSQVRNGVLLPGNESALRAEILMKKQELTKLNQDIIAGSEALSEVLGRELAPNTSLKLPEKNNWQKPGPGAPRPEWDLLDAREELFETREELANAGRLPQVSLFAKPSYGRPGFNFFQDDLQFNWIVGIQARWSLKTARNSSIKKDVLRLLKKNISNDRTLFERNQNTALRRLTREIEAIEEQMEQDEKIVELRKQVADEKRNQVEKGSSTVAEYITELNKYSRAQRQFELRKILRIQAIINYETEQGWSWN